MIAGYIFSFPCGAGNAAFSFRLPCNGGPIEKRNITSCRAAGIGASGEVAIGVSDERGSGGTSILKAEALLPLRYFRTRSAAF